jgi:2-polyprenyl-3-methyl-5-hydroxy-6-metoxy-1,4-benzoquinol methylase
MQDTDWQLFGLDFAKDCIQFARKKFGFKNVFCGNLEEDSFEEEYFDVVTLWSVAAHLEDPLGMFRKINRVLKPGGLLIIYTVDSSSITHKEKLSNWGGFTGNHLIFFNPESLSRALMHSGFEVTKCVFDQLFSKYNNGQIDPKDLPFFQKLAKQHNLGTMMALSSKKICPIYES